MKYKITVQSLDSDKNLTFETENHDDLFKIFDKAQGSGKFAGDEAYSFILGLKLFTEVLLKKKNFSPFDIIRPSISEFMKALKKEMST
jgi:hypothetical protein